MAADWDLAASVRNVLLDAGAIREVKMFGGIGFMLNGNLLAGASKRGLLVRVGKDRQGDALTRSGARPMVMRGRTMEGYVDVYSPALDEDAVQTWMELAVAFAQTLPPKAMKKPSNAKSPKAKRPGEATGRTNAGSGTGCATAIHIHETCPAHVRRRACIQAHVRPNVNQTL